MAVRAGIGYDAHRLAAGRRLVLGGVHIEHDKGLQGHSDADVLCHAVIDAVLGAAADGDLGRHYPDTDARWKDACSLDLLRDTAQRLAGRGLRIVNIDATLLAEAPRIAPHVQEMRRRLAAAAGIDEEAVSVKATTTEGMGAVGRREGMAAMAVATVTGEGKGS